MTAALDEAAETAALKHFDREDVRIVSEEIGLRGEGRYRVVVDPIDGSQNAERGSRTSASASPSPTATPSATSSSATSTTSAPTRSGRRRAARARC